MLENEAVHVCLGGRNKHYVLHINSSKQPPFFVRLREFRSASSQLGLIFVVMVITRNVRK
jgi:hypothetical protein